MLRMNNKIAFVLSSLAGRLSGSGCQGHLHRITDDSDTLYPALRLSTSRSDRLLSRYESSDCRYEFFGYDDYRLIAPSEGRLIFSDGFVFRLGFIVFEKFSNPGLVPASWKSISFFHLCFFFMRRLDAASGFPSKSYAVITNRLSGFGSRT